MPPERWVRGLSPEDILGKKWGQGTIRYIDVQMESKLKDLISSKDEAFDDPIETLIEDKEGKLRGQRVKSLFLTNWVILLL